MTLQIFIAHRQRLCREVTHDQLCEALRAISVGLPNLLHGGPVGVVVDVDGVSHVLLKAVP